MNTSLAFALLAVLAVLPSGAGAQRTHNLPKGYHQGRCLYVVDGRQRIAGRCFFQMERDGSLHIDGPHQVFGGTDTVDRGASALTYSRD